MYLRAWNNRNRICHFNIENGIYKWERKKATKEMKVDGFIKSFFFCKYLAVYKLDNDWWVQYKNNRFKITDSSLSLNVKKNDVLIIIEVNFSIKKYNLFDVSIVTPILQIVDPTYDYLHLISGNFAEWLRYIKEKERNKLETGDNSALLNK